jgi:hypothetical protein
MLLNKGLKRDKVSYLRKEPLTERHVQAMWYDGALRPLRLRSVNGVEIKVIDPGRWNVESGPDFKDAVLEIGSDGRTIRGDIEVHLSPADWVRHKHSTNNEYRNVIAHVTWYGGVASDLPLGCISICLGTFLKTDRDFSPDEIDLCAYPFACLPSTPRPCEEVFKNKPDLLLSFLKESGKRRIEIKTRILKTRLMKLSGDLAQLFYSETMTALGYKNNSFQFRCIAEKAPWSILPRDVDDATSVLLGIAGLMPCDSSEESKKLWSFWFLNSELYPVSEIKWNRSGVRPNNSPEHRLVSAARLFTGEDEYCFSNSPLSRVRKVPSLLVELLSFDLMNRQGQKRALEVICKQGHIGMKRAATILINVVIPFAIMVGATEGVPEWIFPEDINAIMRLTAFRLLGRDHNPALYWGNGLLLQGLMQVHRDFCLVMHPACENCNAAKF